MTAQIDDTALFGNREYAVVGISGHGGSSELFDPSEHGLQPQPMSTACHRGFFCSYAIEEDRLVLRDLFIGLAIDPEGTAAQRGSPLLFGKYPVYLAEEWCYAYRDLNAPLSFTGGILLGAGFIESLYVHMGFQAPHAYRTVHGLMFERGLLVEQKDLSEEMARIREEQTSADRDPWSMPPRRPGGQESNDAVQWIEDRFDREYE